MKRSCYHESVPMNFHFYNCKSFPFECFVIYVWYLILMLASNIPYSAMFSWGTLIGENIDGQHLRPPVLPILQTRQ